MFNLFTRKSPFLSHENFVLSEISKKLEGDIRKRFDLQISSVNKIQRFSKGKEVNLYVTRFGKPNFNVGVRLNQERDEEVFAETELYLKDKNKPLRCKTWLVTGYIFSLTFDSPPLESIGPNGVLEIERVITKILYGSTKVSIKDEYKLAKPSELSPALAVLVDKFLLNTVTKRNGLPDYNKVKNKITAELPLDYLELLKFHNGVKWDGCWIRGIDEIRTVVTDETSYYILVEIGSEIFIGIRENSSDSQLYSLEHDSDPINVGTSILNAISALKGPSS